VRWLALLLASCGLTHNVPCPACYVPPCPPCVQGGSGFVDTVTAGVPNLVQFAPGMWRMGQPPDEAAWKALALAIGAPSRVIVVKLNDAAEGSDAPAGALGWTVLPYPLYPEDDKPWTVLEAPSKGDVDRAVEAIIEAHAVGYTVIWHCSHGRDRTGLISELVGRRMFGWTKGQGWDDMISHGYRWELPDLDAYWAEYGKRRDGGGQ
jgi:hypothetical protein